MVKSGLKKVRILSDPKYPKNDTKYKTVMCNNARRGKYCKFKKVGKCLFYHDEDELYYWDYIRKTAVGLRQQPAEIHLKLQRQDLLTKGKLAVGSEKETNPEEIRSTSPFDIGLTLSGGRKKRKRNTKRKRKKKKRITKVIKRKSRKRRQTRRKRK